MPVSEAPVEAMDVDQPETPVKEVGQTENSKPADEATNADSSTEGVSDQNTSNVTAGDGSATSASDKTSDAVSTAPAAAGDGSGHSLWVTGLTAAYRAADLKLLFSKYGKVIGAKVVTSAKSPGAKCFGFVTLSTNEEADLAIKNLSNTEIASGQKITVEKDTQRRAIMQPPAVAAPQSSNATTLWVNGLSNTTKAADLKMLFFKHAKVTGAKVVTSAKNPGSKCYGLVTLATVDEADNCIRLLNKTEFNGRIISLEKAKSDVKTQPKVAPKPPSTSTTPVAQKPVAKTPNKSVEKKPDAQKKSEVEKKTDVKSKTAANSDSKGSDKKSKPADNGKAKESDKDRAKDDRMLSLEKIKQERERERMMQKERAAREEERRRMRQLELERNFNAKRQRDLLVSVYD